MSEVWKCDTCGGEDEPNTEGWTELHGMLNEKKLTSWNNTLIHACCGACLAEIGIKATLSAGPYYRQPAKSAETQLLEETKAREMRLVAQLFAMPTVPEPIRPTAPKPIPKSRAPKKPA